MSYHLARSSGLAGHLGPTPVRRSGGLFRLGSRSIADRVDVFCYVDLFPASWMRGCGGPLRISRARCRCQSGGGPRGYLLFCGPVSGLVGRGVGPIEDLLYAGVDFFFFPDSDLVAKNSEEYL